MTGAPQQPSTRTLNWTTAPDPRTDCTEADCLASKPKYKYEKGTPETAGVDSNGSIRDKFSIMAAIKRDLERQTTPSDQKFFLIRWLTGDYYFSQFVAAFLVLALALGGVFFLILKSVWIEPSGDWSTTGDMLGAVVGIPVALAGSLVAVLLAHRAYSISRRQLDYDSISYYEPIIKDAVEIYSRQTLILRQLAQNSAYFFRHIETMIQKVADSGQRSLQPADINASNILRSELEKVLSDLKMNVGSMVKNPLCREIWDASPQDTRGLTVIRKDFFQNEPYLYQGNIPKDNHIKGYYHWLSDRLYLPNIEPLQESRIHIHLHRMRINAERNRPRLPTEPNDQAAAIPLDVSGSLYRNPLYELGAAIGHASSRTFPDGTIREANIGYAILYDLIIGYPTEDTLAIAIKRLLVKRFGDESAISKTLQQISIDYGVSSFGSDDLIDYEKQIGEAYGFIIEVDDQDIPILLKAEWMSEYPLTMPEEAVQGGTTH